MSPPWTRCRRLRPSGKWQTWKRSGFCGRLITGYHRGPMNNLAATSSTNMTSFWSSVSSWSIAQTASSAKVCDHRACIQHSSLMSPKWRWYRCTQSSQLKVNVHIVESFLRKYEKHCKLIVNYIYFPGIYYSAYIHDSMGAASFTIRAFPSKLRKFFSSPFRCSWNHKMAQA